jgi:diaminopimelate epimerase
MSEQPVVPSPLRFTKGHGTENDFVLLRDLDGELDLAPDRVARLCDRRAGIGGDGLIRVVRSAACPDAAAALAEDPGAEWFMDYRNADGSAAEMCGNGVRVFVAYLVREQLVDLALLDADGPGLPVASRAGVKRVRRREDGWFSVDMGGWRFPGGDAAVAAGHDATVHVHGLEVSRPALSLDLGNPHTVAMLSDLDELTALDLAGAPLVEPVPVDGTNVELLVVLDPEQAGGELVGRLAMRVHERGVGETRSCGTGACAAALASRAWAGPGAPDVWRVDVPGGQVEVRVLPAERVELSGPAVLVADGTTTL